MRFGAPVRSLAALTVALIYGLCFIAIRAGLAFAPPLFFGGMRALIAGLALLVPLIALGRAPLPERRHWPTLAALALTSTSLGFGAMFESAGRTGAGLASVLGNVQPLLVIAVAAVFLAEPVSKDKIAALAVGLIGVMLVTAPTLGGPDAYGIAGPLVALGASASLALGNLVLKRTDMSPGVLVVTAWQLVLGGLPLLALSAVVERASTISWTPEFWALLLGLALGGTALPFAVWNALAQGEEIGRLALYLFLVPAFGVALAALVFGERYGALQLAGIAMTIVAGAIAAIGAARGVGRPPIPAPDGPDRAREMTEADAAEVERASRAPRWCDDR